MNKQEALNLLNNPETKPRFLNTSTINDPEEWIFLVGALEMPGTEPNPEHSDVWYPMAIFRKSLEADLDGKLKSNGGTIRIYEGHAMSGSGNAHQNQSGIWLWDMD